MCFEQLYESALKGELLIISAAFVTGTYAVTASLLSAKLYPPGPVPVRRCW